MSSKHITKTGRVMSSHNILRPAHTKRQRQRQEFEWDTADAWCVCCN